MTHEDYDVAGLADFLRLDREEVQRLAERGRIPARRVAGQWRFNRAEVNSWVEDLIGSSDAAELAHLAHLLSPPPESQTSQPLAMSDLLPLAAVEVPLAARTRDSVIRGVVEVASRTGWLWDPDRMMDAVRQREDLHPTATDLGAALMHPRRPLPHLLERPFIVLCRTDSGVPFGNARGVMTDTFFLLCSVQDRGHLQTLAQLSRILNSAGFMDELRAASSSAEARDVVIRHDQRLGGLGT